MFVAESAAADPSPQQKAAAEGLFQQAADLMEQGNYADACAKFEGSQELDAALGTVLRLADCYDRIGRTASAWALFQEAAASARTAKQTERERIAVERAADLSTRLSKIEFSVPERARVEGLTIHLNGSPIPEASWDALIPVDPGTQSVSASAPNYQSWSSRFEVSVGQSARKLEVPVLTRAPRAPSVARPEPSPFDRSKESGSSSTGVTIGYLTGGLGALSLIAGGLLGYRAYSLNDDSLGQCRSGDPNACSPRGKSLRDDAETAALASTIAVAAGGALLATGASLVLFAPRAEGPEKAGTRLQIKSTALKRGARIAVQGEF